MHKLKVKELQLLCKNQCIRGYSGKNRQELIDMLEKFEPKLEEKLRMVDLFTGTGAFSYAFLKTSKIDVVFSNDIVESSEKIYNLNFDHKMFLGDLNDIEPESIKSHDILTGGFPCQPFSIAGHQEGFKDKRSNVFWKILEILEFHKPKVVVLENVKNLISHDNGNTFKIIISNLEKLEYYVKYKVLNTSEITGIPHHRERIYIVCFKDLDVYNKFNLNFESKPKKQIIDMLTTDQVDKKYYYTEKSTTWNLVSNSVIKKNTIYQYRRVYVRENKSGECPTLTANMGTGGHNVPLILDDVGIRKLTPRECFNFQGFPQDYKLPNIADCNLYKLAGNAVSVPIVELIANRIMSCL